MKKETKTYLACVACVACLAKISDHKVFDHTRTFIKDFSLLIKQCYHIILWSVEINAESKNSKVARTKNRRIMVLSKCAVCDNKRFKIY